MREGVDLKTEAICYMDQHIDFRLYVGVASDEAFVV